MLDDLRANNSPKEPGYSGGADPRLTCLLENVGRTYDRHVLRFISLQLQSNNVFRHVDPIMASSYARELQVAETAVWRASVLTKRVQSTVFKIAKQDKSSVTIADFAAQALLIGALRHAFPHDSFLGEEDSSSLRANETLCNQVYDLLVALPDPSKTDIGELAFPRPSSVDEMLRLIDLGGQGKGGDKGRFWVMDPIDGTEAFLRGQQYAVSLSLIEDGREVVGVLGCPNVSAEMAEVSEDNIDRDGCGVMLSAVRGEGSTLRTMAEDSLEEGRRLSLPGLRRSDRLQIVGCTACKITRHDVVAEIARQIGAKFPNIQIWSSHVRYVALILGTGHVHFWVPAGPESRMHIWDHAGAQLIFTELGGKVTDLDGKPVEFGAGRDLNRNRGLIVARGEIHHSIMVAMKMILGGC